ncbi:MAG: methyltransferase domain-containing protein [Opitutaceae bacterium]
MDKIVAYMPCFGDINPFAAKAYFAEMSKGEGKVIMRLDPSPCSNMALSFNRALCFALNLRAKSECTHLAMLHADIIPSAWWLDTLHEEMQATGAHWIAAVSPIKDGHGTTSTAVAKDNRWNPLGRLTMHEVFKLPETFCIDDIGDQSGPLGYKLLLNTGCMLLDLRPEYWDRVGDSGELEPHFEIRNRIIYVPGGGWETQTETEDWMLSRILHGYGAKLYATRKVAVQHVGPIPFTSAAPWGDWEVDQKGDLAAQRLVEAQKAIEGKIDDHGIWLEELPDGAQHDEGLEKALCRMWRAAEYRVVDLGCGRGWYVEALDKAGVPVFGVDGTPGTADKGCLYGEADLTEPLGIRPSDAVLCLEVGEHVPAQYQDALLDNICRMAERQVVLSWAVPGQVGHGHVNCQTNEWVTEQMLSRGFSRNLVVETMLRNSVTTLPYFKNTLMAFDRINTEDLK